MAFANGRRYSVEVLSIPSRSPAIPRILREAASCVNRYDDTYSGPNPMLAETQTRPAPAVGILLASSLYRRYPGAMCIGF